MSAKFLQDSNGDKSSVRAVFLGSFVMAAFITVSVVFTALTATDGLMLISVWLGIPAGTKLIQKPNEGKAKEPNNG